MWRPAHHQKVYHCQDEILRLFKTQREFPFVLSGGTALSRFYLHHRYSEDLDFFCEAGDFEPARVESILQPLRSRGFVCRLQAVTHKPGFLKTACYEIRKDMAIKVDFLEDPFSGMWRPQHKRSDSGIVFRVDHIDQIYYRKLFALLEQKKSLGRIARVKDIFDLYVLHTHHKALDKVLPYYRRHHVAMDEETLLPVLAGLDAEGLKYGLDLLRLSANPREVIMSFKRSVEKILRMD